MTNRWGRYSYGFDLCLGSIRPLEVEAFKQFSTEGPTFRGSQQGIDAMWKDMGN
jgi:hypothetical protein